VPPTCSTSKAFSDRLVARVHRVVASVLLLDDVPGRSAGLRTYPGC
jgi:hypothetical protein